MAVTGSTLLTLQNLSYYDSRLKKWVGSNLEDSLFAMTDSVTYHAMAELGQTDDKFLYFLTDTGEIFKSGICFGKSSDLDEATLSLLSTKEKEDGEKILLFDGKEIKGGGGVVLTEEAYSILKEAGKIEETIPYFISDTRKILINDICINVPNNKKGISDAINLLGVEESTPTDNDYMVLQGDDANTNIFYRKTLGTLWKWIKSKVEALGYTTNTGTITGITMNGISKGTSGEVDLGTVITSHQSLNGYATEDWVNSKGYLTSHQSLNGYATQSWVENKGYTTNTGTVTAVKINGSQKNPANGVIDLGNVITSKTGLLSGTYQNNVLTITLN